LPGVEDNLGGTGFRIPLEKEQVINENVHSQELAHYTWTVKDEDEGEKHALIDLNDDWAVRIMAELSIPGEVEVSYLWRSIIA